jgi:phytol kinase
LNGNFAGVVNSMLTNNWLALIITFVIALAWLRIMDFIAQRGWISNQLSRKLIHAGTGPIFVMCWVLFKDTPSARYLAALVPAAITFQFLLVGLGIMHDEASVQAMSRTGNPREILRGPLFYGIIFVALTIIYWYTTPIGIVALMMLSGGDGLADILGRRWGKRKLPWSPEKSWVGSFGMFIGGWIFSLAILAFFSGLGYFPQPFSAYLLPVTLIALLCTLVESFPVRDFDNITITLTALIAGHFLF